jgi:hypothetical protein
MIRAFSPLTLGLATCISLAQSAVAQPDTTLTLTGGYFNFGTAPNRPTGNIDPAHPPTMNGYLQPDGTLLFPAAEANFPPADYDVFPLGTVTVQVILGQDGIASIDPVTFNLNTMFVIKETFSNLYLNPGCAIGDGVTTIRLNFNTTDCDPNMPTNCGAPYDPVAATATLAEISFSAPDTAGTCGAPWDGFFTTLFGLPAPSGSNQTILNVSFNPPLF